MWILQCTAVLSSPRLPPSPPPKKAGYRSCTVVIWSLSDINTYMYLQWDNKSNKGEKKGNSSGDLSFTYSKERNRPVL